MIYVLSCLLGIWQHSGYIYQGKQRPPFNPDLILTYEFKEDQTDRLFWTRKNETGFCERLGKYRIENNILVDEVTWVNPKNASDCGKDPDMAIGKITRTPFEIVNNQLHLHLHLGDEPFIYVWDYVENSSTSLKTIGSE